MFAIIGHGSHELTSALVITKTKKDAEELLISSGIHPKTGRVDPKRNPHIDDDYKYKNYSEMSYLNDLHCYLLDNPTIAERFVLLYFTHYEIHRLSIKKVTPMTPMTWRID